MLETTIQKLQAEWVTIKSNLGKAIKNHWRPACAFILHAIDVLIIAAEENMISLPGSDRKAAVLAAFVTMFSTVIVPILPFYLKPFAKQIQTFIITIIISGIIDYVVNIYNKSSGGVPTTKSVTVKKVNKKKK